MHASKTSDIIDHWLVFKRLLSKDVPLFIIRLLIYWYSHQQMCIKWRRTGSSSFCVSNDVNIPYYLYNIYITSLSISLNSSNIGKHIVNQLLNHLCYVHDLCLISMSSAGMQRLLHICTDYAEQHSLQYNGSKSFSMCFKSKTIKLERPDLFFGDLKIPLDNECTYLGITIISEKNCDQDIHRQTRQLDSNANI